MNANHPSRDELIAAWHRRCPSLTREEAAKDFDDWWRCGCLDVGRDVRTGAWQIVLTEPRARH